jgi:general secretion pathway protein D
MVKAACGHCQMAKDVGGNITLNFEGVDVREVLRTILGDILRENYIVDPRVGGSITMRTTKPIPKAAAMHTLEEVLRMNGAAIVRESDGVLQQFFLLPWPARVI